MSDMGLKFDMAEAAKGEEQGNPQILKELRDPGRQGTEVGAAFALLGRSPRLWTEVYTGQGLFSAPR